MRMVDIITKKRDGGILSEEEIHFFVKGVTDESIPLYQTSALLMAILFKGMTDKETAILTSEMEHSGSVIDLKEIPGIKVDKHSTGGVGDKTSLALAPLVAACGGKVAKMSGRGLGHTGGTLDKMESVPGTNVFLTEEQFKKQVKDIGIAIIGQTASLDPCDKKLYALRDVTGTVPSLPLIASSIMSKKLASGSDAILLDVKFGSGAFMKTLEDARTLSKLMVKIGDHLKRDTQAIITDMDEPLGLAVGNILEVKEAVDTLHNHGPKDFHELVLEAGGIMLVQSKIAKDKETGRKMIEDAIKDGRGFKKMCEMFKAQGGDISYLEDLNKFPVAKYRVPIFSPKSGYIKRIDSLVVGESAMKLGGGRATIDDVIDYTAGVVLEKKVGDYVKKGEVIMKAHTNKPGLEEVMKDLANAVTYQDTPVTDKKVVYDHIS